MVRLRRATADDLDALTELARETWDAAFGHTLSQADRSAYLERELSRPVFVRALDNDVVLLAEEHGRLLGYAQYGAVKRQPVDPRTRVASHDQELRRLYVRAEAQNRGIGRQLMEAALQDPQMARAGHVYLDVWEHNPDAQRFYRRFGFEVVGSRTFAVASGAETSLDLVMVRRRGVATSH